MLIFSCVSQGRERVVSHTVMHCVLFLSLVYVRELVFPPSLSLSPRSLPVHVHVHVHTHTHTSSLSVYVWGRCVDGREGHTNPLFFFLRCIWCSERSRSLCLFRKESVFIILSTLPFSICVFSCSDGISLRSVEKSCSMSVQKRPEYLFKILVIGEMGCGKTSIIRRYVHNMFSDNYKATVCPLFLSFSPLPPRS